MDIVDTTKKLDAILDKYDITRDRDAVKDDIYYDIILEAWYAGRQTGKDTHWK